MWAWIDTTDKQRCQCKKGFALHSFHHSFFFSYSKSSILLPGAPSPCLSFSWLQRPPTQNRMVLYLADRCAITRGHLDHNRTLGLRFEARHVFSLCLFFISVFLSFSLSLSFPPRGKLTPRSSGIRFSGLREPHTYLPWFPWHNLLHLQNHVDGQLFSQFEKHTVWVFGMHTFKAC